MADVIEARRPSSGLNRRTRGSASTWRSSSALGVLPDDLVISRKRASWIDDGHVRVNGRAAKPTRRLVEGDEVESTCHRLPSQRSFPRRRRLPRCMRTTAARHRQTPGSRADPAEQAGDSTLMHALLWRAQS